MAKKELIGHVGVDSGQLLIADPCYIDSEWTKKEFKDERLYRHTPSGKMIMFVSPFTEKPSKVKKGTVTFKNYDEHLPLFGGKNMNEMLTLGIVEEVEIPGKAKLRGSFSYAGVCETTLNDGHQLHYNVGHAGAGVAFRSGYGDGTYPVYAKKDKDGRVVEVTIDMR